MATVTDQPDFTSFLLKYNDEKGLSVLEIRPSPNVLIPRGSETTGTFLTGTTWHNLAPAQESYGLQDLGRGDPRKLPERGRDLCHEAC